MIRRIRLGLVILVCVVLQTTLFTHLQIDGVAPDIGLVAVLAVAWEDGPDTGALYGFLMGWRSTCSSPHRSDSRPLSFAVTGYAVGVFQTGVVRTTPWLAPILGGSVASSAAWCSSPPGRSSVSRGCSRSTACAS